MTYGSTLTVMMKNARSIVRLVGVLQLETVEHDQVAEWILIDLESAIAQLNFQLEDVSKSLLAKTYEVDQIVDHITSAPDGRWNGYGTVK